MKLPISSRVVSLLLLAIPLAANLAHAQQSFAAPMEIIRGKPYVMVMVNDKGPFRFLVDTGTGAEAIVTPALVSILDPPRVGEALINDPSGQGGQRAPLRLLRTLNVAGLEFYDVKAIEHTLLASDAQCDGLLGFTLFKSILLTLDYPKRRLILADGELETDAGQSVHPFRIDNGVPIAALTVGTLPVEALLDSAGAGLAIPERLEKELHFAISPVVFGLGQSISTRYPVKMAKLATDVHLGEITIDQPWIEINPAFPLANFGSVPMQHFIVTFDQENLLVRLEGSEKRITLGITPSPVHLIDQPSLRETDPHLVPIG